MSHTAPFPTYRIEVRGWLDDSWSEWFEGFTVRAGRDADGGPITVITGPVRDQAALQGVLAQVWRLNLSLLAVTRIAGYDARPSQDNPSSTMLTDNPALDE